MDRGVERGLVLFSWCYSTITNGVQYCDAFCIGKYLGLPGFSPVLPTPAYPRAPRHTTQFIGGIISAFSTKRAIAVPPEPDSVNRDSVYPNSHGVARYEP